MSRRTLCSFFCLAASTAFAACSSGSGDAGVASSATASSSSATSSSASGGAGGQGGQGGAGAMGGMGGSGGMFVCPPGGVSKGPWSLQMKADEMTIRWEACVTGTDPHVVVESPMMTFTSTETPFTIMNTYTSLNVLAPPDYAGTYYTHEAKLTGLTPATCYDYHLATDPTKKGRFCTSRNTGDDMTFLAIGDTNPGLGATASILSNILPSNPDFTLHCGDIQYYSSGLETWAYWFEVMQPMLSQGGFYPAIGNHEMETPTEITDYEQRFFGAAGFDGTERYYRFQSGGVWFFALDTQDTLDVGSPQYEWFKSEIADASTQPGYRFSVVFFHKPFYTCGDTADNPQAAQDFTPIFQQYGVPLVLQAHMHGYERFEIDGITWVTAAGGGGSIGNPDANTSRSYCDERVASGAFYHGEVLSLANGQLSGTVIDDKGKVRDSFMIAVP